MRRCGVSFGRVTESGGKPGLGQGRRARAGIEGHSSMIRSRRAPESFCSASWRFLSIEATMDDDKIIDCAGNMPPVDRSLAPVRGGAESLAGTPRKSGAGKP